MQALVATNEGLAVVAGLVGGVCGFVGFLLGTMTADSYWKRIVQQLRARDPYTREFGDADVG